MEEKELTLQEIIDLELENLWEELKTAQFDRNGRLKTKWYGYPKGTDRKTIHGWFATHYSKGLKHLIEERKTE